MKTLLTFILLIISVSGYTQTFRIEKNTDRNLLIERFIVYEGDFEDVNIIRYVNMDFEEYFNTNNIPHCFPIDDRIHFYVTSTDSAGGKFICSVTSSYSMIDKKTIYYEQLIYLIDPKDLSDERLIAKKKEVEKRFDKIVAEYRYILYTSYRKAY